MINPLSMFILLGMLARAVCLPAPAAAESAVEIDLTQETRREVAIAVPQFIPEEQTPQAAQWGGKARRILENDLRLSELFLLVKPDAYDRLARQEADVSKTDYAAWHGIGVQWIVKTRFKLTDGNKSATFVFRLYDAENRRFLVGKRYRADLSLLRRVVHRFADEVVAQLTGKPGLAGTRIAFTAGTSGKKEVYIVDFDGHEMKKLTDDRSLAITPAWDPDGRRIVFTSYAKNNPDLIMIDLVRKKRWAVLKLPGLNAAPAWSPDGSQIALVLSKDGNSEIYVLNKNSTLKRLTHHYNIDTSPSWSPDGKKIVFTSDRSGTGAPQIYIMDAAGDEGVVKRISFGSSYNDNPAWSPGGDKIAYASRVGKRFQIKIYHVETAKTEAFTSGAGSSEEPSWSPDGNFIAYRHTGGGKKWIEIKRLGENRVRRLANLPGDSNNPTWSPYLK